MYVNFLSCRELENNKYNTTLYKGQELNNKICKWLARLRKSYCKIRLHCCHTVWELYENQ